MRPVLLLAATLAASAATAFAGDECKEIAALLERGDMRGLAGVRQLGPRGVELATALVPLWDDAKVANRDEDAEAIAEALRSIGADALLARTREHPEEAWATIAALTAIGRPGAEAFDALFDDDRDVILRQAARSARWVDSERLDDVLVRILGTRDTTKRAYAAYALVSRIERKPDAIARLLPSLLLDPEPRVRAEALRAASDALSPKAAGNGAAIVTALSELTESNDADTRAMAAEALGRLEAGAAAACPALARLVEDASVRVRIMALVALRRIGSVDGAPAARRALEDPKLAFEAARTLVALAPDDRAAGRALVSLLRYPDADVRKEAVARLKMRGRLEDDARREVQDLLGDAHPMVRAHAAWVLWNDGCGWQVIRSSVLRILKEEGPWEGVQEEPPALICALALVEAVGTDASVTRPRLEELARFEGFVGEAAARALRAVEGR
jgi:hypothetical protein